MADRNIHTCSDSPEQALAILQSLREKRKNEHPSPLYNLVREIYRLCRHQESSKKDSLASSLDLSSAHSEAQSCGEGSVK